MALFGGKKDSGAPQPQQAGPIDEQIAMMMQQGYTDQDIVGQLQSQGFPPEQIQDAMTRATMQTGAPAPGYGPLDYSQMQQGMPPDPMGGAPHPMNSAPQGNDMSSQGMSIGKEQIEEVAESIIQEKWEDLLKTINKLNEWKTQTETDIAKMQSDISTLKELFDNLHKGVLGKIGEYDKNLSMVGTEIKAMEKVFQKVLPTFTENVNKLERLTNKVSSKK